MPQSDSGKVALVTGGASGIGRATVERFLDNGDAVVAADLNAESGERLLSELAGPGGEGRLIFVRTNVAEETDVAHAVERAVATFGRLDKLVNNAGLGGAFGPVTEVDVEDWDYTFDVLVRGVYLGVKHGARAMIARGEGGAIVNIGSVAGLYGGAGPVPYSSAKAAVINFTRSVAIELAAERIRVNVVCPGFIRTPLALGGRTPPDLSGLQPWPEHGEAHHVADVIAFLCGDGARFVTGTDIAVDGGLTAAGAQLTHAPGNTLARGVVGVNRGTTGERSVIRRKLGADASRK
ncbi:MAG: 3-oxoacyl-(acyl-carrier-protein) reductase [Panacagrimonas sp.]|jgi:NAD(P)-dependent dehydrogenase (short-subunit alcohol dehydrogenase family)|nr:SDR family oxidoreductase [Panacagrimonas sp.]MCC2655847.1 3-oxoacyl-(acyl-carrier-protein) reductase [Panacagrimonas sp.]